MTFAPGKQVQVKLVSGELKVNNALNHHWCETSLPCTSSHLKHVASVQRFHCQKLGACDQFCWSHPDCLVDQQM